MVDIVIPGKVMANIVNHILRGDTYHVASIPSGAVITDSNWLDDGSYQISYEIDDGEDITTVEIGIAGDE